ncbi:hypothetical protein [Nocardia sp. NPDC052566]|uniref:hypothetical protein n=1 Tax=Nocardia sp. NPDC052566 TaxID=3364330 RepID=UPI0037C51CD4
MRRIAALRKRSAAPPTSTESSALPTDPNVDPPLVATLIQPLLKLRASLGTGVGTPDATITAALSAASTQAADTEGPHRDGLHALESTWTARTADAAVPALRTTQTEIGEISDRGPAYLSVLSDAQATSSRAAKKVDQIIADFRRDARQILANATTSPDTDAVVARAAQALRDAITAVTGAQTEMDDHTRRLDGMGPLTVTQPAGVGQYGTGGTAQPGTAATGAAGVALDPAQAAQLQLQQSLISAGVQLGTAAIDAGVNIGTHLIDKIVEVGTKAMDTVAASADKAIDKGLSELLHPGSTTANAGDTAKSSSTGTSGSQFDFGAKSGQPTANSRPGAVIPPAQNDSSAAGRPESRPPTSQPPFSGNQQPSTGTQSGAPAHDPPQQPGTTGGVAMPPPRMGEDQERPRDGQLGVTVPALIEQEPVTVPAAVIGDFGDDTL